MLRSIPCLLLLLFPAPGIWAQGSVQRILAQPNIGIEQFVDSMDRAILRDQHTAELDRQQLSEALDRAVLRKDTLRTAWTIYYLGSVLTAQKKLPDALAQFAIARDLFTRAEDAMGINRCIFGQAQAILATGDLAAGLPGLQQALHEGERSHDTLVMVLALGRLGYIAGLQHDLPRARSYYEHGVRLASAFGWCGQWVNQLRSIGNAWKEGADLDRAIVLLDRADSVLTACSPAEHSLRAMLQVEKALVDIGRGRDRSALEQLDNAQRVFDSLAVDTWSSYTLSVRASLLLREGRPHEALKLAERGLRLAEQNGLTKERGDNLRELHHIAAGLGDYRKAYDYHLMLLQADTAFITSEGVSRMASLEAQFEREKEIIADSLSRAQERVQDRLVAAQEVRRERTQRNVLLGFAAFGIVFAVVDYRRRRRIKLEHARSEALLLNILPEEVAEELKSRGEAEAVHIDQVTVLFTDFKGFTALSETLSPKELVRDLNECFSAFDRITEKYGIEKIKTIGDAYMAAGGLPTPNTTHALDVVKAALEMRDFVTQGKERKTAAGLPCFEIRIGVHTGPVVAGIVGVKKFQYDIWGDTVNTASRMESSGEVGEVNISEATYALVREAKAVVPLRFARGDQGTEVQAFTFIPRGKIQAKGKGEMEMFFVRRSSERA